MGTPEDLFTTTLRRHADTVEAPTRRFAQEAHLAAGRVRRRRRITAAIGVTAVVAAAVPAWIGISGLPGPDKAIQPAQTQSAPKTVTLDPDELDRGPDPAVPWYADGHVHVGAESFPVGEFGEKSLERLVVAGDGFAVSDGCCLKDRSKLETRIFDRHGKLVRKVPGGMATVSADGRTIVTALASEDESTFVATDTMSGEEIGRKTVPSFGASPAGFVGDRLVYSYAKAGTGWPDTTVSWDPRSDVATPVSGIDNVVVAGGTGRVAVATRKPCTPDSLYDCHKVVDLTAPTEPLWHGRSGDFGVLSFSADGRYAFAAEGNDLVVYDLAERRHVLRVRVGDDKLKLRYQTAWEPSGGLLMVLENAPSAPNGTSTIVRCSLDGQCERASESLPVEKDELVPTYQLAKQD